MGFFSGYTGPRETRYLFVDGGALRSAIDDVSRKYFGGRHFQIDFELLSRDYTKTFFYDALPVRKPGESESDWDVRTGPMQQLLRDASATDGVHVYAGDARDRRGRGLEQKKVDVKIAVDMLSHSFRRNMHQATLLTGDNDFKPLLDALRQDGMFVTLWYPSGKTGQELQDAADARRPLSPGSIRNLLTGSSQLDFELPNTQNFAPGNRPNDWQQLKAWDQNGIRHFLFRDNNHYVVVREHDPLNELRIRHSNLDFVREHCLDNNINVPN
jgi:uncharacterized LabA/DUF88 family protein